MSDLEIMSIDELTDEEIFARIAVFEPKDDWQKNMLNNPQTSNATKFLIMAGIEPENWRLLDGHRLYSEAQRKKAEIRMNKNSELMPAVRKRWRELLEIKAKKARGVSFVSKEDKRGLNIGRDDY